MTIAANAIGGTILVCALTAFACARPAEEPERPAGVPADAVWVAGADGGVFIRLEPSGRAEAASYTGAVYHPHGEVWFEGTFRGMSTAGGPIERDQIAGWDGERILLRDGRSLVAEPAR